MPAWLDGTLHDLRLALRTLRRAPAFAAVAVLTLALGIGGTAAAFSIIDPVLLRGLPYQAPGRLRTIYERRADGSMRLPSYPTYRDWKTQAGAPGSPIADVAFVRGDAVRIPDRDGEPQRLIAGYVSQGFFGFMGTRPLYGRVFGADEARPGGPRVAVLSYDLFMDRFGGDPRIVGTAVDVDSVPTTIVGVMPRGFAYPNFGGNYWMPAQLWEPLAAFDATHPGVLDRRALHVDSRTLVRLRAGADSARAAGAMRVIQQRLAAQYPSDQAEWTGVGLQAMSAELFGTLPRSLLLISGAIALVLLLACANVANLFLVRGSARARELAVRQALGAGRWRLVRQLFAEALVLSLAAGALGAALASAIVGYARHAIGAMLPFADRLAVDARALAFVAAVSAATALLVGLAPALQAGGARTMEHVRAGGVSAAGEHRERRARSLLVSLQFALALTLLVGSGLLVQSFRRLASVPLGYTPQGLVSFTVSPDAARYGAPQDAAALYARILDAVNGVPGVQSAAAAGGALLNTTVQIPGAGGSGGDGRPLAEAMYHLVSADYLRTMRTPLLAGRWFTGADMRAPSGLVVSQRLARLLWPGRSPLGQTITVRRQSQARADFGQPITLPVIGVVADVHEFGPAGDVAPEVYVPYTLEVWPWMQFTVRAAEPAQVIAPIKAAVRGVDPSLEFRDQPSVERSGAGAIDAQTRFITAVLSGFALGALLLSSVGLYGIVAYGAAQRTREIGIRIALGATRGGVVGMVLRDAALFVGIGAVAGVAGALASTRMLRSMLFETAPTDPATFIGVTLVLALAALGAAYLPARRAARTDPTIAIRAE
ncbi:MAG TPA: ABC transporter permease [Gemmatimonadaceae bacterium]|nr:ABC transporter permease [Gemmatimonadaceae bacterium]